MSLPRLIPILALAACAPLPVPDPSPAQGGDLPLIRGYRSAEDPCRIAGESALTPPYLDDAADLVACPAGSAASQALAFEPNVTEVAQVPGYDLYSVQRR